MSADILPEGSVSNEFLKIETTGLEAIPLEKRRGRAWELGAMWAGAFTNYASLLTGSLLAVFGLGVLDSFTAIITGTILAAVILGLVSVSGPRGGVPQIVFSRALFGYHGAYVAGALTLFLAIGWFAVDCVIATNALAQVPSEFGGGSSQLVKAALLLGVVLLSILVAIYGHRTVVVFERYGALIFLVFCITLFIFLAPKINWALSSSVHGSAHLGAWILGVSVTFALVASWFSFAADYSRYLSPHTSSRVVTTSVAVGTGLTMIVLSMLGVLFLSISTKYIQSGDLLGAIVHNVPLPLAVAFLLFVAFGMIWANYLDIYTAGLVVLALDVRLHRWQTACLAGIIGGVLAYYALFVSSFLQTYENFLLVTYIWAPAWAAVVIIDLFVLQRHDYQPTAFFRRTGVRWPALLALLVGTAAAVPFVDSSLWQSPLAVHELHGADLSGLVSFITGGLTFFLFRIFQERAST
jgi:NCS1 family nucleobase:cation symporter-1